MSEIFIRAGLTPFDRVSPDDAIQRNILGNNSGNMIYAYGVFRALMTEGTHFTPNHYKYKFTDREAAEINEKYDMFVIPLANAFRDNFINEMDGLASLVRRLTIPSVVIGVGVNYPSLYPDVNEPQKFDDHVRSFLKAVLDKSALVGIRGEVTASYLKRLGFREGTHFRVIGCPSMYSFGEELAVRNTKLHAASRICVNHSTAAPANVHSFTNRVLDTFSNSYLIYQTQKEFRFLYSGMSYMYDNTEAFPCKRISDSLYMEDRIRFFLNVPTWREFMQQADLSIGARLHGNIIATLAGTPSVLIPKDARMREIAEFHNLTHVLSDQITEQTDVYELFDQLDMHSAEKAHSDNFDNYKDFLDKNDLDHIWNHKSIGKAPLDQAIEQLELYPAVGTLMGCDKDEIARRLDCFFPIVRDQEKTISRLRTKLKAEKRKGSQSLLRRVFNKLNQK